MFSHFNLFAFQVNIGTMTNNVDILCNGSSFGTTYNLMVLSDNMFCIKGTSGADYYRGVVAYSTSVCETHVYYAGYEYYIYSESRSECSNLAMSLNDTYEYCKTKNKATVGYFDSQAEFDYLNHYFEYYTSYWLSASVNNSSK